MSNLLLITDVARLQNVFGRLVENTGIRLRVVNNLEKGGEEIAIEKPDVVFVQTHLSGLSADILLKHLKKQLGRKRSRFVLLASPAQTNDAILKTYQGWLDTSTEDGQLFSDLLRLLEILLNKPKNSEEPLVPAPVSVPMASPVPVPVSSEEASALLGRSSPSEAESLHQAGVELPFPVVPTADEPSLEEQGVTYAPRQRLTVYSEFNSSFDTAVSSASEPERLEQAAAPAHDWRDEEVDSLEVRPTHSKNTSFLLWLVPVVIVVVAVTFLQQQKSSLTQETSTAKAAAPAGIKTEAQPPSPVPAASSSPEPASSPAAATTPAAVPTPVEKQAAPKATTENPGQKSPVPTNLRLKALPGFIPLQGLDNKFSETHPGWQRFEGKGTEFKVFRESQTIKAIQVIDRSGNGMRESFMKNVLSQVARDPVIIVDTSEKKSGYEIQRGRVAETITAVYYRDEIGGRLCAFVLTWQ